MRRSQVTLKRLGEEPLPRGESKRHNHLLLDLHTYRGRP